MSKPRNRTRLTGDPWKVAEAAFKKATVAKEMVTLRIDRDVLNSFQEGGPG
jgi:uncharacterized protein (DUF4415 family)